MYGLHDTDFKGFQVELRPVVVEHFLKGSVILSDTCQTAGMKAELADLSLMCGDVTWPISPSKKVGPGV